MSSFNLPDEEMRDHIVIAGYGRVGMFVARLLERVDKNFVVIENNPARSDEARDAGFPTIFGDVVADPVLEAASVSRARLVILTIPDALNTRLAVDRVRSHNEEVRIVARSERVEQLEELGKLGVYEAVQPEFEAGLELGRQALSQLGVGAETIQRFSDQVRRELYAPMSDGSGTDGLLSQLRRTSQMIETEWMRVAEGSDLSGKTIAESEVRSKTGVSVVAIVREEEVIPSPGPDAILEAGDVVGVLGTTDQRRVFRDTFGCVREEMPAV